MYPVSDDFLETITQSHKVYTRCEVYAGGVLSGVEPVMLDILDGNVVIDDVAIRRRANVSLTDPTGELTPASVKDLLSPLGTEIRLYRGVYLNTTGEVESVPLITGGLADVHIDDSGQGLHILLDIFDRSRKVSRAKLAREYVVNEGTYYDDAILALLKSQFPFIETNFPTLGSAFLSPLWVFETGADPWAKVTAMANAIGYDIFFDAMGVCVMQGTLVDPTVVDTYNEGANSKLLYLNKRMSDESIYNHVVVTGESSSGSVPFRGEALDDDPYSSTYYLGPMGDAVFTSLGNSFIMSDAQAVDYASFLLQKKVGAVETIQITGLVNPALDLKDTIQTIRAKANVDATYVVDKLTIPLTFARGISISSRQRTITSGTGEVSTGSLIALLQEDGARLKQETDSRLLLESSYVS